jgi:hypothetical protein
MPEVKPELFADGKCGKPLPAGELLQVFKFGQFSPVKVLDGEDEAIVVVGTDRQATGTSTSASTSSSSAAMMVPSSTGPSYRIGNGPQPLVRAPDDFTFKALLAGEDTIRKQPAAVISLSQEQVAETIASGAVGYRNRTWSVDLTPDVVDGLVHGVPVNVDAHSDGSSRIMVLQPTEGLTRDAAESPSVTEFEISEHELSRFLADPRVPGEDDLPFKLTLTDDNVEGLVRNGVTTVDVDGRDIDVKVMKKPPDLSRIPGGELRNELLERGWDRPPGTIGTVVDGGLGPTPNGQVGYKPRRPLRAQDFEGVTLAVYFEWVQEWTLKGFSRGRLLHSLSMGPQEETTIELFTWDRRKRTLEQSSLTETEESVEDEEKTQDATEVYRELTKKDEFQWKAGGELDAQYNGGTVNVKLKAQAEAQDKTNAEDVTKNTTKAIQEGVRKAAAKVKTSRSSKISESTEIGREERITRKVRNPNMTHTLNLDYYEVMTHYEIETSFNEDGMRFCAMIRNPLSRETFPPEFIRRNEAALRDAMLDRGLVAGFDALRLMRARQVAIIELAEKKRRRQTEPVPSSPGKEKEPPAAQVAAEESAANNYLTTLRQASQGLLSDGLIGGLQNALRSLADNQPSLGTKKGSPRAVDLDQGKRYLAQQLFLRYYSQLAQKLGELAGAQGSLSIREWGPKLAPIMPSASEQPRPSQLNLESMEVKEGAVVEVVRPFVGNTLGIPHWPWWWGEIRRVGLMEPEDAGAGAIVEQFPKVYKAFLDSEGRKSAADEGKAAVQQAQQTQDQLSDEDRLEADFPLRDYAMAKERAEVLEEHLKEHKEHYSFALFRALPPQEQLDHIERAMSSINTGFDPGFYQPRVVSQIGSHLLVPLNHEVIPKADELLDILKERIAVEPEKETVLLPSPGMTIDARLGQCSAGEEFIEDSRGLDLDLRRAQLRQAQAEADRLEKRVENDELDDPKPQASRLQLEIERVSAGPEE